MNADHRSEVGLVPSERGGREVWEPRLKWVTLQTVKNNDLRIPYSIATVFVFFHMCKCPNGPTRASKLIGNVRTMYICIHIIWRGVFKQSAWTQRMFRKKGVAAGLRGDSVYSRGVRGISFSTRLSLQGLLRFPFLFSDWESGALARRREPQSFADERQKPLCDSRWLRRSDEFSIANESCESSRPEGPKPVTKWISDQGF